MFDWGFMIGTAVGAVVGVGGTTIGACMTNKAQTANLILSLDTEAERARHADKRRIYAQYLASLTDVSTAIDKLAAHGNRSNRMALESEIADAAKPMYLAQAELRLICPEQIDRLAKDTQDALTNHAREIGDGNKNPSDEDFRQARLNLLRQMRADLEPAAC